MLVDCLRKVRASVLKPNGPPKSTRRNRGSFPQTALVCDRDDLQEEDFKHFGQQRLNLGTREEQLAPFVRSINDLNTFADDITIQMGGKLIGLPRNGFSTEQNMGVQKTNTCPRTCPRASRMKASQP